MADSIDEKLPEEVELFLKELKETYEKTRGFVLVEERQSHTDNSFSSIKRYRITFILKTERWTSDLFSIFCEVREGSEGYTLRISHSFVTNGFLKHLIRSESGDLNSIQHRELKIEEVLDNFRMGIEEGQSKALEKYIDSQSFLEYIR